MPGLLDALSQNLDPQGPPDVHAGARSRQAAINENAEYILGVMKSMYGEDSQQYKDLVQYYKQQQLESNLQANPYVSKPNTYFNPR